jgi:hypothetical protein
VNYTYSCITPTSLEFRIILTRRFVSDWKYGYSHVFKYFNFLKKNYFFLNVLDRFDVLILNFLKKTNSNHTKKKDKNEDENGKISLREFKDHLTRKKATNFTHQSIFSALDKDGNGSLDFGGSNRLVLPHAEWKSSNLQVL